MEGIEHVSEALVMVETHQDIIESPQGGRNEWERWWKGKKTRRTWTIFGQQETQPSHDSHVTLSPDHFMNLSCAFFPR